MKIIGPKHKLWTPRSYQEKGVEHLCGNASAALFYDPGLGKTSTTLAAFKLLQDHGVAHRALVIAPVRVCQLVWEQEAAQWTQFKDLRFANMASKSATVRANQLLANADIWLINPESVPWLAAQFQFRELPFDTLIIDELTKFKNSTRKRSKMLQPLADKMRRRWGLTGTPAPNGYEDLFGQMKILDSGASLGQYISQYRDRFFTKGKDGFKYELRPGADVLIQDRLRPYVHALRAEDYLDLPPLINDEIKVELDAKTMAQYRLFKKQMVLDLADGSVTAVNAAALANKLTQFTGGAMYLPTGGWTKVHDAKLDALEDLVEELQGQQLLVAYHYGHELERLLARFPEARYIGGGVTEKQVREIEEEWNAGKLKLLFGHPASMGHGLNMQKSGASHICWFTLTWDFELFDQFIKRILRQGTTAKHVINHRLVVDGTIDNVIGDAVSMKREEQDGLLDALKAEFIKDDPASARVFSTTGESEVRRVTLPADGGQTQAPAAQAPAQAQGWGRPAAPVQANVGAPTQAPAANTGWGNVAPRNAQADAQEAKVAAPQTIPINQAAQAQGWGRQFATAPEQAAPPTTPYPGEEAQRVDPELAVAGSFSALEALQSQVLQPGELQPQFAISSGGDRVNPDDQVPFEGGQPVAAAAAQNSAQSATKTRAARGSKKADKGSPYAAEVFAYVAQRLGQGATFEQAQDEAAALVEALEG